MIDVYVMPIKCGKTKMLLEKAVKRIVKNEETVLFVSVEDDSPQYIRDLLGNICAVTDCFDVVAKRFKFINVPYGKLKTTSLVEFSKMFNGEIDAIFIDNANGMFREDEGYYISTFNSFINHLSAIKKYSELFDVDYEFMLQDTLSHSTSDDFKNYKERSIRCDFELHTER